MDRNITKDAMYDAVAPEDFGAMLDCERHLNRSTAFDRIISLTHEHFWDPLDPKYIDFAEPFDMENEPLLPEEMILALKTDYVSKHFADPKERTAFINEMANWQFSSILHGEQGALNLSASLCHVLKDAGAQEYAANQTREEGRHVTAFAKYIHARWGRAKPCGDVLRQLLEEIVAAPEVYKKIVGMQMLVEGLAMGSFALHFRYNRDPVARKLFQLVMTDEAFHHKFGKIWAERTVPHLTQAERNIVEDWAAHCFQALLFNQASPQQQQQMFGAYGLDPERVTAELRARATDERIRRSMGRETSVFRVLVKTLWNAGLISERTRAFYAAYVDLDEIAGEGDRMIGDAIAEEGIAYLQAINFRDRAAA
ncbi:MAG: ferritin-like domain-containing protein [Hyphomonadaceae bacterium]